ncbi:FadR/GntR family transcriptional regulator [Maribacter dokdonensis]|uniref:GntR family transcriptional regulator, transcriptional repressor for pyruvate dehydrogenase complex n=1 Tax=Maribacter dokdonensis TaxID=320912 RepID=A0A1H4JLU9_9FLAO|nr:FadR/GntR family transcriptional regulator [Maribacter dokdonensis]SDR82943.1 GntR family transcriptional regulator, transcriptional repressor for pyruvate dehydrogenase complex [Maribacter dokdonensis]SEB47280.1 transcriptional regulator, GntR family [Maribacter dokdonensis]|tara:strand:+ start:300 stop:1001 length:702 start_codon:yes stop_codon:yes gene_type:complete
MKLEILTRNESNEIQNEIILQLRDLMNNKNLEPGDKLPSERTLSEKFGVSRSSVREAIQKLEFYGILVSKPQSGTFVAEIGQVAMNGMVNDILRLDEPDFKSLVETRILLELKTVRLAARRRTGDDLELMKNALDAYREKVENGEDAVQEDLLFHLAIAKASGNSTMNTFMLIITPEILTNFEKYHVCDKNMAFRGIQEHQDIFDAIKEQNPQLAKEKMKVHFKNLYQFCYNI